jgi:hypothetical protein
MAALGRAKAGGGSLIARRPPSQAAIPTDSLMPRVSSTHSKRQPSTVTITWNTSSNLT